MDNVCHRHWCFGMARNTQIMRKVGFIFIMSLLCCFTSYAQKENDSYKQESLDEVDRITYSVYKKWQCEKEGYYGSFWWRVVRSDRPFEWQFNKKNGELIGYYYYEVQVYSNSYLRNGGYNNKAIAKISYITIKCEDHDSYLEEPIDYYLCDWETTYLYSFTSDDENVKIELLYEEVTAYHKSMIE